MKYLTRDWYNAGHDDDVYFAYRRYLTGISERLTAPVLALALSDLHDARFLDISHDPQAGLLAVRLRIGFRRLGYADLHLAYDGVELFANDGDPTALLADPASEVIYHEVDVRDDGRFEHRLLLSPRGELTITFNDLAVSQKGVEHRAVP
ncbi:MAG TPA: hypothetical protein VEX37_10785 [Thermomicrobiales bacterium]|nr:hypothetical protein [Thermomicrobiales bacterium]